MNDFLVRKFNKSKRDAIYSQLTDEMEVYDYSPKKFSSPSNKLKLFKFSRKLFPKNNKSFKMNAGKKNSDSKNNVGKIRKLFNELQNKVQTWSQEIRDNFQQHYHKENKTPSCVTPNRRIRYMLGRTPEKLYSPFGIETPPSHYQRYTERAEYPFAAFHGWLTPPKRKVRRDSRKLSVYLFDT